MTERHRIPAVITAPTGHIPGAVPADSTPPPTVKNVAPFFEGANGGRTNGPIIRSAATAPKGHL